MKWLPLTALAILAAGCGRPATPPDSTLSLPDARKGFQTSVTVRTSTRKPAPVPPAADFRLVRYDSPVGPLAAYLTPDPADGRKRPAVVWVTGGDCNTIDEGCWQPGPDANDQSASAYRKAGIVMLFPSLRGGNENPGKRESFFGEVDDVLAAADFLAEQPHVDPSRIYLGGHSTGGTLALLAAQCSDRFRAVFSFGPVADVSGYPLTVLLYDTYNPREAELRSPGRWLHSLRSPVFVFEGTVEGNVDQLRAMAAASKDPRARFLPVPGADHFSVLAPVNRLLAGKILGDAGPALDLTVTEDEVGRLIGR
ncbi:MAG: alpha/beta hydrolase family protein [Gemmataceae bacterium]